MYAGSLEPEQVEPSINEWAGLKDEYAGYQSAQKGGNDVRDFFYNINLRYFNYVEQRRSTMIDHKSEQWWRQQSCNTLRASFPDFDSCACGGVEAA
jgi:hypothetical protein